MDRRHWGEDGEVGRSEEDADKGFTVLPASLGSSIQNLA